MSKRPILHTNDLTIGYIQGKSHKAVLNGLNLHLHCGEVVSLLGSNGAGKSTLLRTISGVQHPLSGDVILQDKTISDFSPRQMARLMGIVYTDRTLAGGLTVEELVSLGRQPYTGFFGRLDKSDRQIVSHAISTVGIERKRNSHLAELSDGERQKAIIAKALAQQTPIIIMDEPTAFLDAASRLETMALLHRLAHDEGKAILLSTHDISPALAMSDSLWMIRPDRVVLTGTPEELAMRDDGLKELFSNRKVEFDPLVGDYRGQLQGHSPVTLECPDPTTAHWLTNLLRRNGFTVCENPSLIINAQSMEEITLNGSPMQSAQHLIQTLNNKEL